MRLKVLLVCILTLSVLSACARISGEEIDNESEIEAIRTSHFYQEGDVIETETFIVEENEEDGNSTEQAIWYSYDIQTDMYNLIMELKNNKLLNEGVVYLNQKDESVITLYDALSVYDLLKDKKTKSGSKITFETNDELAGLLGLRSEDYIEELYENIKEYESVAGSSITFEEYFGLGGEYQEISYDKEGNQCDVYTANITFYVGSDVCVVRVLSNSLANIINIGDYIVFIDSVQKVRVLGDCIWITTDDGYEVYINVSNFQESMNNREYGYFNKLSDFCNIYGFVIDINYIMTDYYDNSQFVAEMYNLLDAKNDWSEYVISHNKAVNLKTILKKYIIA